MLSNQCSVAVLNAYCCPLIFFFLFTFIYFCAVPHVPFFLRKKKSPHHSQDPSRPYIYRGDVRRYGYGCLATAKTYYPPSFSLRCKLIGLCWLVGWLLWRYCLWWLPLAVFIYFFILGRCLDSPCWTAWRVTVATMNCVWRVVSFLLLFCPGF